MFVFRKRTTKENERNEVSKTSNLHRKTKLLCLWTIIKVWFVKTKLIHPKYNSWGRFQTFVFKVPFQQPYNPEAASKLHYGVKVLDSRRKHLLWHDLSWQTIKCCTRKSTRGRPLASEKEKKTAVCSIYRKEI